MDMTTIANYNYITCTWGIITHKTICIDLKQGHLHFIQELTGFF